MICPRVSGRLHCEQVEAESLSRSNELEEMREKLEARRLLMERMSTRSKVAAEDARMREETLSTQVRSLLVAGTALSVSRKRLQVVFFFFLFLSNFDDKK